MSLSKRLRFDPDGISDEEYARTQLEMRQADLAWDRQRNDALDRAEEILAELVELTGDWRLIGYGGSSALLAEVLETIGRYGRPPGPKARSPIAATKRVRIFARDGFRCLTCGETDPESLTLDHIVAASKGGSDDDENLRTLCRPCNSRKGTKDA